MKRKKAFPTLLALALFALLLTSCGGDPGTPPELLVDGMSIVVGESTPGDLGITVSNPQVMVLELPDNSWTSQLYIDGYMASVCLVNETKSALSVNKCVIHEVKFFNLDQEKNRAFDLQIEGVNPLGMTEEELIAAYPDLELDDDEGTFRYDYLRTGSDYYVRFVYKNGVQDEILVAHKLDKSYQEKK